MLRRMIADPCQGLPILRRRFPADGVLYSSLSHQVAFVGAISEHSGAEGLAIFGSHGTELRSGFGHASLFAQAVPQQHANLGLVQHFAEYLLADFRFIKPSDVLSESPDL